MKLFQICKFINFTEFAILVNHRWTQLIISPSFYSISNFGKRTFENVIDLIWAVFSLTLIDSGSTSKFLKNFLCHDFSQTSESKKPFKLNNVNKTTQNVSNPKTNQNLHQITSIYPLFFIKVGLSPSKKITFICFNESPLKMMQNAFYFNLK